MLVRANLLLLSLLVIHGLDHAVHQHEPGGPGLRLTLLGAVGIVATIVSWVLARREDPRAAPVAVLVGLGTAVGFVAVHVLPHWSAFSEPYASYDPGVISWILMLLPALSALALAAVGARELAHPRPPRTA